MNEINFTLIIIFGITLFLIHCLNNMRRQYSIPLACFLLFASIEYIPQYMGYPVDERYVQNREALILGGNNNILMVLFKGESEPRLISIENIHEAQEALDQAKKKSTFVIFNRHGAKLDKQIEGGTPDIDDNSSLHILKSNEETILRKDNDE